MSRNRSVSACVDACSERRAGLDVTLLLTWQHCVTIPPPSTAARRKHPKSAELDDPSRSIEDRMALSTVCMWTLGNGSKRRARSSRTRTWELSARKVTCSASCARSAICCTEVVRCADVAETPPRASVVSPASRTCGFIQDYVRRRAIPEDVRGGGSRPAECQHESGCAPPAKTGIGISWQPGGSRYHGSGHSRSDAGAPTPFPGWTWARVPVAKGPKLRLDKGVACSRQAAESENQEGGGVWRTIQKQADKLADVGAEQRRQVRSRHACSAKSGVC